jgi:hypothetical protein
MDWDNSLPVLAAVDDLVVRCIECWAEDEDAVGGDTICDLCVEDGRSVHQMIPSVKISPQ